MTTCRRLLLPLLAALAAACFVALPALAASPPDVQKLLERSAAALDKKDSLHIDVELHSAARGDGSLTEAQVKKLVPPTDVTLAGDLSRSTIVMAGKMTAGGQSLAAELRTNGKELYVKFGGAWYGTKDAKAKGSGLTINTSPKQLTGALSDLMRGGLEVKIAEGPEVDGVSTWKLTGSFDPKTLAKIMKGSGLQSSGSSADLTRLAGRTDVTVLIGRDDALTRRVEVTSTLTGKDLTTAKSSTSGLLPLPSAGSKGIRSALIDVIIDLSKFGQKIAFDRPSAFKPLDRLFESLLGGATTTKTT